MSTTVESKPFSWSYSQLKNFETCPKRYYHYNVAKDVVEPESAQLREGNDLHKAFELRLKDGIPLELPYAPHEAMLSRIYQAPGKGFTEQKLAFSSTFQPTTYFGRGVWFRTQIDYAKVVDDKAAIFDWKTGKPKDDLTQLQLMAAAMFIHMPTLQRVKSALVFVQHEQVERAEFERGDLTEIWGDILPRVKLVERARSTQTYPPKPGGLCKSWCAVTSCPFHGQGGR